MTYPPPNDRLRHLLAQRINCHVDTWKVAFFIAGAVVDDGEIRAELDRIAAAHSVGQPCGDQNCPACFAAQTEPAAGPAAFDWADDGLRDRIADVLADADGWKWAEGFKEHSPTWHGYQDRADAVLAMLPPPADRAAVLLWAADTIDRKDADQGCPEDGVRWATTELRRMAAETQQSPQPGFTVDQLARMLAGADVIAGRVRLPFDQLPAGEQERHREAARALLKRAAVASVEEQPDTETPASTVLEQYANEAHAPSHTWTVESPRRDQWGSWGATYDERVWSQARYEDAIENAPNRPFRLVRATTTYTVEAEHTPPALPVQPAAADTGEETFVPPAHYRRDDGVDCCVHTIPVGPDSCPACRELADDEEPRS